MLGKESGLAGMEDKRAVAMIKKRKLAGKAKVLHVAGLLQEELTTLSTLATEHPAAHFDGTWTSYCKFLSEQLFASSDSFVIKRGHKAVGKALEAASVSRPKRPLNKGGAAKAPAAKKHKSGADPGSSNRTCMRTRQRPPPVFACMTAIPPANQNRFRAGCRR